MAQADSEIESAGGVMLSVLMDGNPPGTLPTPKDLDSWLKFKNVPFSGVLDSPTSSDGLVAYYGAQKDTYFIIDLATMRLGEVYLEDWEGALDSLRAHLQ